MNRTRRVLTTFKVSHLARNEIRHHYSTGTVSPRDDLRRAHFSPFNLVQIERIPIILICRRSPILVDFVPRHPIEMR